MVNPIRRIQKELDGIITGNYLGVDTVAVNNCCIQCQVTFLGNSLDRINLEPQKKIVLTKSAVQSIMPLVRAL